MIKLVPRITENNTPFTLGGITSVNIERAAGKWPSVRKKYKNKPDMLIQKLFVVRKHRADVGIAAIDMKTQTFALVL